MKKSFCMMAIIFFLMSITPIAVGHEYDIYCLSCGASLWPQKGFDETLPYWVCTNCGEYILMNDTYAGERFPDSLWFCDRCGDFMNAQSDFSDINDTWKCKKCGYVNAIAEENTLDLSNENNEKAYLPSTRPVQTNNGVADILNTVGDGNLPLNEQQINSISMLNYLAGLTQEINTTKNSRLFLEDAYSDLFNNTHPNAVDEQTQEHLVYLLDTLNNYRMIAVKRDRLQFIYEQNQAQAMRKAIPNPLGLLSAVSSFDWKRIAASVVYMAVDSYSRYKSEAEQADIQYIQDGWELDDEESKVLHDINKETFEYLNDTVRRYSLPGDLALNEEAISSFVRWKNNGNDAQRIRFLETSREKYKAYGNYWIVLAESYYSHHDYQKCLEAIATYESLNIRIFRDDKAFAKVLPLAIISASEVYKDNKDQYVSFAEHFADLIILNSNDSYEWSLRYFAAQTYIDIFTKTGDQQYLKTAYDIVIDNVNELVEKQKALNQEYLHDVVEQLIPKDASKIEKTEIENYNKQIKEDRKHALPPVYEPLLINCELLFSLADQLNTTDAEKRNIDEILHENGNELFLIPALNTKFSFVDSESKLDYQVMNVSFNGKEISFPAKLIARDGTISVSVNVPDQDEPLVINDWVLIKVDRPVKNSLDSFMATYKSSTAEKNQYHLDSSITITISASNGTDTIPVVFEFETFNTKQDFWSNISFWKGSIGFRRVR